MDLLTSLLAVWFFLSLAIIALIYGAGNAIQASRDAWKEECNRVARNYDKLQRELDIAKIERNAANSNVRALNSQLDASRNTCLELGAKLDTIIDVIGADISHATDTGVES